MKKSQVVATLAAASAMGIVAPLASTASAFTVTSSAAGAATGEAECWELDRVKENIKKDSQYDWFANRDAIVAKYGSLGTPGKEYSDITNGADYKNAFGNSRLPWATGTYGITGQNEIDFQNEVKDLKANILAIVNGEDGVINTADDVSVDSIKFAKEAGRLIEEDAYRVAFGNLITALNSGNGVIAAINAFRVSGVPDAKIMTGATKADGVTTFTATEMEDPNMLPHIYTIANLNKVYGANTVSFYTNLNNALSTVKPQLAAAEAGKAAFETLLNSMNVLDAAATATYTTQNTDTNPTVVYNLKNLATTVSGFTAEMQAWSGLYNTLSGAAAPTCNNNTQRSIIFGDIWGLAESYKAGEGRMTENTEDIAAELINNQQQGGDNKPGTDKPSTNKPGTTVPPVDESNKPSGDKPSGAGATINKDGVSGQGGVNKNGVPNTGVMISEGTNATSASTLSALIATLAIAGASWTIFRRNKKNA